MRGPSLAALAAVLLLTAPALAQPGNLLRNGDFQDDWITLLPEGDPCDWDSYYWHRPPPADCLERCLGRPHLTWIFVLPLHAGQGVGTALLAAAVRELLALGYTELASTFMIGNDSSMLWHWRNGFRLLAYPGSRRLMRMRWQQHRG